LEDIVARGGELLVAGQRGFGKGDIRENAKKLLGSGGAPPRSPGLSKKS